MAIFNTPPAETKVTAIFNAEIYEVRPLYDLNVVATFTDYQDMCDWVAENCLVLYSVTGLDEEADYKQKYEELQAEFEQYKKESIKWSVEDFLDPDSEFVLTPEQAQEALEHMISHHDACNGITWETVACFSELYGEPKQS